MRHSERSGNIEMNSKINLTLPLKSHILKVVRIVAKTICPRVLVPQGTGELSLTLTALGPFFREDSMELIKTIGRRACKTGKKTRLSIGLFYCPHCRQEVEKDLSAGKKAKSCGCAHMKLIAETLFMHGEGRTKLYSVWRGMKKRCFDANSNNYKYYGARGITVCDEWENNFIAFRDWALSHGYKEGLMIDRRDNNGNYKPDNCRFVTIIESNRNMRTIKLSIEKATEIRHKYNTGQYTQYELGDEYNIDQGNISLIINNKTWKLEP